MTQVLHELIAIVIISMKELLIMGMDRCGGKSVKGRRHCLWCNIYYREISILEKARLPFSVVSVNMITLKREISLDFGLSYWTHGLVDGYLKYFPPEITTCDCLNTLKITVTFLLFIWPILAWLYFPICFWL